MPGKSNGNLFPQCPFKTTICKRRFSTRFPDTIRREMPDLFFGFLSLCVGTLFITAGTLWLRRGSIVDTRQRRRLRTGNTRAFWVQVIIILGMGGIAASIGLRMIMRSLGI
jgi:hypothetical protein